MSDKTFNQRQWKNKPVQTMECMNCGLVRSSVVKACQQCGSLAAVSASLLNDAERGIEPAGVTFHSGKWAMGISRAPTAGGAMEGNARVESHAAMPAEYIGRNMVDSIRDMAERLDKAKQPIVVNADYDKVDRSTVVTIKVGESISNRQANDLARGLRDAIQQRSGFIVPIVVTTDDFHITFGRRPVAMPEHVRAAYAEAAAADFGVTPDVVQAKKAERRALKVAGPCPIPVGEWFRNRDTGEFGRVMDAHLQTGKYPRWHLRIEVHNEQGEPQGIGINDAVDSLIFQWKPDAGPTPMRPPFGSKAIGTDLVPYPEPAL